MLYETLADLTLRIDSYELELQERETSSDFTRTTTTLSLHGGGESGRGEDVTYDSEPHYGLTDAGLDFSITGSYSLDSFSELLDDTDLFLGDEPGSSIFRNYRRWMFESTALDSH